jgi:BirA family biotin operon repressor/biotin-[acetyl-CoA-carboxylase] ligase
VPSPSLQGTRTIAGTAAGIDDAGSLIVRDSHGRTHRFRAGEVTLSRESRLRSDTQGFPPMA